MSSSGPWIQHCTENRAPGVLVGWQGGNASSAVSQGGASQVLSRRFLTSWSCCVMWGMGFESRVSLLPLPFLSHYPQALGLLLD